jgi:hypothetical protein
VKHSLSFTAALLLPFCALAAVGTSTEINVQVVGQAKVIEAIQLCSTSGATVVANTPSPPMFPLMFKKGDVPAGQYPQLQAADGTRWGATFINVRHWQDGSMKIAGVLPAPFPKNIPAGCVNANVLNGGAAPAASGLPAPGDAGGLYSEQIQANVNGFSGALGSNLNFSGNWSAKLANDAYSRTAHRMARWRFTGTFSSFATPMAILRATACYRG